MSKFSWGTVINRFDYDFDGKKLEVVKFHPWVSVDSRVMTGTPDEAATLYHCEELRESFYDMDSLLISWIARKNIGLNQHTLVQGICRALSTSSSGAKQ
jgi:hypothetical protein